METVTFLKEVPIADSNGQVISEGSVLKKIETGETGVVIRIMREGDRGTPFDQVGDVKIETGPGTYTVSNQYSSWVHVPKEEQTFSQRYLSWLKIPYEDFGIYGESLSKEEKIAIDGVLAILPEDAVDWEHDCISNFEDALDVLVRFLTKLKEENHERPKDKND